MSTKTGKTVLLMCLTPLLMPFFVLWAACLLTHEWLEQNWRKAR